MNRYFNYAKAICSSPTITLPINRVFLLSHMRANTSLLGHVLGSNKEIDGYYELHIGYNNKRSFLRQKLRYYQSHSKKCGSKYIFDKVLHNHHVVNCGLISHCKNIIMVRNPEATISSLMKLYSGRSEKSELATLEGAQKYYLERLTTLNQYASSLKGNFYFLLAEDLIHDSEAVLCGLSEWLNLSEGLRGEYSLQPKTGAKGAGDSSKNMSEGRIITPIECKMERPDLRLSTAVLDTYSDSKALMKKFSINC